MNKIKKIGLWLLMSVAPIGLSASEQELSSPTMQIVYDKVLETIAYSENVPGLESEEFAALKMDLGSICGVLMKEGVLDVKGRDQDVRPCFVALQGVIEHVLASELQKSVHMLKGVIHTPMPATPLCTTGDISKELIDPSIEVDPSRLFTVKARTTIVRDYLFKNGVLYVAYPKAGLLKRSDEQQTIYKEQLLNHPASLIDTPLECASIPDELIGATYFFQDGSGKVFVFAIRMTQAKDPKELGHFGLWFGPIEHPAIQQRVLDVATYLGQYHFDLLAISKAS